LTADRETFEQLAEPYRRQLHLHCYRMLGSFQEAEDLVQETFLRAWRARDRFEGRTSFRNWLYRIATNACLNALSTRPHTTRILPTDYVPSTDAFPAGEPASDVSWLQPYPDWALEDVTDTDLGPEVRYELQESVQLAFLAAIQRLPPRQRVVVLLRDVLGWSAAEAAELLEASSASVNSALQRGRATLAMHLPTKESMVMARPATDDQAQRLLLDQYLEAWYATDIDRFVSVLREDATLSMPPWPNWYRGREAIARFFGWAWPQHAELRVVAAGANWQPAFVQYARANDGGPLEAQAVQVLTLSATRDAVVAITIFLDPEVIASFRVPLILES
jgi:RNA polymerase sigma-70 factor (ECF subfamily)